jgi:hypothetical protein
LIHDWIDNRPEEILKILREFKVLLTKYGIGNSIRPNKTYAYLLKNDFRADRELTHSIYDDYNDYEASLDPSMQETVDTIIPEDYGDEEEYWTQSLMDNDLNTLIENAFAVHEMNYFYDDFMLNVFGFLTLAITMLLLYFQWGSVISLVISIPITGVFFFIGALLYIMIRRPWEYDNTSNFPVELFVYLLLYGLVLLISILGVKRVWNSYVTNIALTISYFLSPLLLTMLTFFTHALFTTNVLLPCQEFPSRVEPFSLEYGWAPFVLIYSPYPLFWISLFLIKTIIAKKEA